MVAGEDWWLMVLAGLQDAACVSNMLLTAAFTIKNDHWLNKGGIYLFSLLNRWLLGLNINLSVKLFNCPYSSVTPLLTTVES